MPTMIKDGTGNGTLLKIDNKNRVRGYVIIEEESSYINRIEKQSYTGAWDGGIKATNADDFIVYLKNTGNQDM